MKTKLLVTSILAFLSTALFAWEYNDDWYDNGNIVELPPYVVNGGSGGDPHWGIPDIPPIPPYDPWADFWNLGNSDGAGGGSGSGSGAGAGGGGTQNNGPGINSSVINNKYLNSNKMDSTKYVGWVESNGDGTYKIINNSRDALLDDVKKNNPTAADVVVKSYDIHEKDHASKTPSELWEIPMYNGWVPHTTSDTHDASEKSAYEAQRDYIRGVIDSGSFEGKALSSSDKEYLEGFIGGLEDKITKKTGDFRNHHST